jgi:hypothetical protein
MSQEEDRPPQRSFDELLKEMKLLIKHQVQLKLDGHAQYIYFQKVLNGVAKDCDELKELTQREPRDK